MAITSNQRLAASTAASDASQRGAPTSPDNIRNILLAYIAENGNFGSPQTWTASQTLADSVHISFGTSTGTKIGTAATQKLAFWNATPVVQPAHIADPSGGATIDAESRTAIIAILAWQATLGLTAAS
jgi:hypothetical protein